MKRKATVVDLSASTRAVITHTPSGRTAFVTFVRGNSAFTLSDAEARKLEESFAAEAFTEAPA